MKYLKPYLVAEAGCNHKGDINVAKEMIKIAAKVCHADAIKFQKRNNKELLTKEQYNTPHPHPENSYGPTYGAHREFLEFNADQHGLLKKWCEECGIEYSTSVWDLTSAKEIAQLQPNFIKIPSACNNHYEMLEWICNNYKGKVHISLGMTSQEEEKNLIRLFEKYNRNKDLVLYSCTSGYPVSTEDVCLLEIKRINELYANRVGAIGFSGHHIGYAVDIAAYTLGAKYIERHFTLNRKWKGTDHSASLEPDDMKNLAEGLKDVHAALQFKSKEILDVEKEQRKKLKYRADSNKPL